MAYFARLCLEFLASNQVCVSLLSEEDGKDDIVEATREFCTEIEQKLRRVKEMEPDLLHTLLKGNCRGIKYLLHL